MRAPLTTPNDPLLRIGVSRRAHRSAADIRSDAMDKGWTNVHWELSTPGMGGGMSDAVWWTNYERSGQTEQQVLLNDMQISWSEQVQICI